MIFSSLVCHRDVDMFKFNWFCSRAQLDHGFDIPHLVLSDGSLTEEDKVFLRKLPRVTVEDEPITIHSGMVKAEFLGKLECFKRGFSKYTTDRVVVIDCDIFFYKNWESDLRKICQSSAIAMRDWGSSLGPEGPKFKKIFGVQQDTTTPNCNSGIISTVRDNYYKLTNVIDKYLALDDRFNCMQDQGLFFAAYYGELKYVDGIVCIINNAEYNTTLWDWVKSQRGSHLMGMRVRPKGVVDLINHSLQNLPETMVLKQFTPVEKKISWGLLEYDTYHYAGELQRIPSTSGGVYITDAMYMHGGSWAKWQLPDRCKRFTAKFVCMDTGIPQNVRPVLINGKQFNLNDDIDIPLDGYLHIITQDGPGAHLAFLNPKIEIDRTLFDMPTNINEKLNQ